MDFFTLLLGYRRAWIAAGLLCRLHIFDRGVFIYCTPIDVWNSQSIFPDIGSYVDSSFVVTSDVQTRYPPKAELGLRAMSLSTFFVSASSLHDQLYFLPSISQSSCL